MLDRYINRFMSTELYIFWLLVLNGKLLCYCMQTAQWYSSTFYLQQHFSIPSCVGEGYFQYSTKFFGCRPFEIKYMKTFLGNGVSNLDAYTVHQCH